MNKKFGVKFTIEEDKQGNGFVGLMPMVFNNKGWDSFYPNYQPAHDILEHQLRGEKGLFWQEIRALGAVLYTRGWQPLGMRSLSNQMAGDFISSLRDAVYSENEDELLELPKRIPHFELDSYTAKRFEYLFDDMITYIKRGFKYEINDECDNKCSDCDASCVDCDCTTEICDYCRPNFILENFDKLKRIMIWGYCKAENRWGDLNVSLLFEKINAECKKHENFLNEFVGTDLTVTLKCEVSEYSASATLQIPQYSNY